ncbi:O-antigen polymerase [Actinoallomurus sp. CA-150999]|uniref:O-antigen polymerase n=1 Tax=Actinoallomurus sp. CA-150999 TaxID=3239887 RepID=UPI003D8A2D17
MLGVVPYLAVTCLIPADDFRLWWRTPKYFGVADAFLTALLLSAFVVGTLIPSLIKRRRESRESRVVVSAGQQKVLLWAGRVFLVLALIGYASWAVAAVSRGYGRQQLHAALTLEQGALLSARTEYLTTLPGITTLTQVGPLALICLLLDRWTSGRRHTLGLVVLVSFGLARGFFNAERIALMELAVPVIVLAATIRPKSRRRQHSALWATLPIVGPLILATVFGALEYTRSWNDFYARHSDTNFVGFALRRLGGYYATAGNNSAIVLTYDSTNSLIPRYTGQFLWNFPIVRSFMHIDNSATNGAEYSSYLYARYGNLEFNNPGGILPAIIDYGLAGAIVWWGAIGLLIGICYRTMRSGELRGLVLYAVIYVGVLEMGMLFYWGLGRAFPVIAGGLITWMLLHRARARED